MHKWFYLSACLVGLSACGAEMQFEQSPSIKVDETQSFSANPNIELKVDNANQDVVSCSALFWLSEIAYETKNPDIGDACGHIDKTGLVKFTPEFMSLTTHLDSAGTLCLPISQGASRKSGTYLGWFYITKDGYGRGHKEQRDNGCDRRNFLSGVGKTYVEGKLAYMNSKMEIIHQTQYEFGENFWENNLAIICSERPKKRLGPHKEHFAYLGGKCGQINSDYDVVSPVELPYEMFRPLPEWAIPFYSRDSNIKTRPDKAEELKNILDETFLNLPKLKRFSVSINHHDPDIIHVEERWESRAAHTESLTIPYVQRAIAQGRLLIETITSESDYEYDPENDKY